MTHYQITLTDGRASLENTFLSMTEAVLFALVELRLEVADFEIRLVGEAGA
jgi:hypothetical protein